MGDALVVTERRTEIAMKHSPPVVKVLLAERHVETVEMPGGGDVRCTGAFSEHLLDGIAWDKVNEKEDEAYHHPDHGQGVEHALEKELQLPVPGCQLPILACVQRYRKFLAEVAVVETGEGAFDFAVGSLRDPSASLRMSEA